MKRNWKKIVALVLISGMTFGMFPVRSDAQNYGEWLDESLVNGSFEVGYEGMDVYGWHLTSMTSGSQIESTRNWKANYTLKTAFAGDNKVAALSKNGGGYAAMTSKPVTVQGGIGYRLRYDYRTTDLQNVDDSDTNKQFYGIHVAVKELDANGNCLPKTEEKPLTILNDTGSGKGKECSKTWSTVTHDFITQENAASIVVYLAIGGSWDVKATVQFDNVSLDSYEASDVINGDFEATCNGQDGGRAGEKDGPATWSMVTCDQDGTIRTNGDFRNNYVAEIVEEENGNHVLKQYPCQTQTGSPYTHVTQGYTLIQSSYIPITEKTGYSLMYDVKITAEEGASLPNSSNYDGAYAVLWFYNSEKELIKESSGAAKNVIHSAKDNQLSTCDWKPEFYSNSTPADTAYVKIGFYIGGVWDGDGRFAYYYDNVSLWMDNGTNGAEVFNGDGEISDTGVPGWSMVTTDNGATPKFVLGETDTNWAEKYTISCKPGQGVDGSNAILVTKQYNYGYAALASSKLKVEKGQTYHMQYSYKMTDFTKEKDVGKIYPISTFIAMYDAEGSEIGTRPLEDIYYGKSTEVITDWTSKSYSFTPEQDCAYAVLYLGMGSVDGQAGYKVWFDDIAIVPQTSKNWTEETTNYEGSKRNDKPGEEADFNDNYDIMTVNEGNRKDVLKLYVTREDGILGAVTYFSEKIPVRENTEYVTKYNLKIAGRTTESNNTGAVYVVRWLDNAGNVLSITNVNKSSTCPKENQDWTSYTANVTAPANAVFAQIGLLIGGDVKNTMSGLTYYYDNITLTEKSLLQENLSFVMLQGGTQILMRQWISGILSGSKDIRRIMLWRFPRMRI